MSPDRLFRTCHNPKLIFAHMQVDLSLRGNSPGEESPDNAGHHTT